MAGSDQLSKNLTVGLCVGCEFHLPEALTLYDEDDNEVFTGELKIWPEIVEP